MFLLTNWADFVFWISSLFKWAILLSMENFVNLWSRSPHFFPLNFHALFVPLKRLVRYCCIKYGFLKWLEKSWQSLSLIVACAFASQAFKHHRCLKLPCSQKRLLFFLFVGGEYNYYNYSDEKVVGTISAQKKSGSRWNSKGPHKSRIINIFKFALLNAISSDIRSFVFSLLG